MTTKKRPSGSMAETRAVPSMDRPTLMTCDSCGGDGLVEPDSSRPGSYRLATCQWCDGVGYYSARRQTAYRRWKRIKAVNVTAGRCK